MNISHGIYGVDIERYCMGTTGKITIHVWWVIAWGNGRVYFIKSRITFKETNITSNGYF